MTYYQGRFRVESARLPGWDYTAGWYFVTICTLGRRPFLGNVVGGVVHRLPIGDIVADEWRRTADVRPNVTIDAWVVMPDHFHAIIAIDDVETPRRGVSTPPLERTTVDGMGTPPGRTPPGCVAPDGTRGVSRLHAGSLGAIVGQWKSMVTRRARAVGYTDFAWQPRFYDVIISDRRGLEAIRRYIAANPGRWHGGRSRRHHRSGRSI
jgi:hypothetical protein